MKLIQLNTLSGFFGPIVLNFFEREKADILHLQEVMSSPEGRSDFFDFLQSLQQKINMPHVFFSPTHDYKFNDMPVYFGNAILSETAFQTTHSEFTHQDYKKNYDTKTDTVLSKLFQHAITDISGKKLNLVNYHGHNVRKSEKRGNAETEKHCLQLANYISKLDGPVILTGDFNLAPDSKSLEPLNALLKNLCIENKIETTRNIYANSMIPVDYIWVSNDVRVNKFEVLPDAISDHAALALDFDI